jgi:hypothetical protein
VIDGIVVGLRLAAAKIGMAALGSGYPEFAAANRSSKRHINEVR